VSDALYLAWRYLARHRVKTAILVFAVTLIVFLPVGLNVLVRESASDLTRRADATPLIVGAKASPLELVLSALYFESSAPEPMRHAEVERIAQSGLAAPIPLYVRFRARGHPIVGTTLEYFAFRELSLSQGRRMAILGECVLGARVAERLGIGPGDKLVSSPESVFDLAGVYPLEMTVVGVLAPAGTPDDRVVFVDVKTAWVIAGHGHGHQDLTEAGAEGAVLARDEAGITANASLSQYNVITPANIASFHFHAGVADLPVSAAIAVPRDEKSRVLLMGRYAGAEERVHVVRPALVMEELLDTVLTIQRYVVSAIALAGTAAIATTALVFWLSIRLRRREIETMIKIGASPSRLASVLIAEVAFVLLIGAALAAVLTELTRVFGSAAIRAVLL
jgi:putative ABC transport system permease protein